ncbi:hypothetical protein FHX10_003237 [Rhizobium sp. BK591]|uniref:hypothetical protein n=1 Tax=Rhizobium sp. BK591 TaxID=2586985 RepID=UPI00160D24EA|nr:hypothetical protein [Rhizobium sp. BK591]MBB3743738.1 hypothetical protein [Rhizobium sp. BK591]
METNINIDLTQVTNIITGYQTALMSFCAEWAKAYPEKIGDAESFLAEVEATYDLPVGTFSKTIRVLRGETDEA